MILENDNKTGRYLPYKSVPQIIIKENKDDVLFDFLKSFSSTDNAIAARTPCIKYLSATSCAYKKKHNYYLNKKGKNSQLLLTHLQVLRTIWDRLWIIYMGCTTKVILDLKKIPEFLARIIYNIWNERPLLCILKFKCVHCLIAHYLYNVVTTHLGIHGYGLIKEVAKIWFVYHVAQRNFIFISSAKTVPFWNQVPLSLKKSISLKDSEHNTDFNIVEDFKTGYHR